MSTMSLLEPGTLVVVAKHGSHLTEEEAGVVIGVGCDYHDPTTQDLCSDGVLVKLQISNTKGIFPPSHVTVFQKIKRPLRSRRRSNRVTPSPTPLVVDTDNSSTQRKRARKGNDGDKEEDTKPAAATATKKSKYFNKGETDDDSNGGQDFRVQRSPSSSAKCQQCKTTIAKNLLRLQPTSQKKGWYHVSCAKICFDSIQSAEGMEGYEELTTDEQKLLRATRTGEELVPISDAEENKDSNDGEDDPPLATLKQKPAAKKKAASKKKPVVRQASKPSINNEENEEDDRMIRASDTDSDDLKDMPYRIEHATTGRATCKGCDERIAKGELRVAERPLFRGKPGFVVYRHLKCTVFTDQIEQMQDVGGWRRLKKKNRDVLVDRVEESKLLIEQENQELEPDELVQAGFQGEIRKSPPGFSATLLPFQVEGTSWMYHQEVHIPEIRGGILADEMGMGKTVQTITTILDNRPKLQHCKPGMKHPPSAPDLDDRKREESLWKESLKSWHHEMEMANVPKKLLTKSSTKGVAFGARAGTLVVCPVIALTQWKEEIEKFTEEKALSICFYHGPNRAKEHPRELLCKYDVVLTTYQVIEADFRKMISPNKVKCPNCGGSFKIDKLRVHLKYFCGESAQRTEAQARQRRTADHHPNNGGGSRANGGGDSSTKKKKSSKSKAPTTRVATKTMKVATKKKRSVHVKRASGYDSDSDLSVPEDLDLKSPRPTRSAAKTASMKLTASAKQWGASGGPSDLDDFSDESEQPSGDEESSVETAPTTRLARTGTSVESPDSDSGDSESEDDEVVARSRKRQKLALDRAKANKKKGEPAKKKSFKGGKGKEAAKGPAKGQKRKKLLLPDESSESSSEESSGGGVDRDPLEGIDLAQLMEDAMVGSRASVLHTMCWWRIVLDEAHMIKSRSSQTAAAAFSLTSIHRWCLSGTPLQNRVGELYSLIRFLRIDPMAHYFCRKEGCGCKSIHYRMLHGKCQGCGHSSIQHFSHFNKHVLNPIQRAGYQGDGRRAMMKLKNEVLDKSLIRRTKQSRAEDMNLPSRHVNIRTIRLHPVEEDFYNALYTQTRSSFDDYVTEGTLLNNYAHIFDLLTKMRQAVDHPYLIVYSKKNTMQASARNAPTVANGSIDCDLCHEPPTDRVVSSCCGSAFCRNCVLDYMSPALESVQLGGTHRCPSCSAPFTVDLNQASSNIVDDGTLAVPGGINASSPTAAMPSLKEMTHVASGSILRRINLAEFATSTKVEALVQELVQMRQKRPGSKALVFSQFVNMLDLIRWRLHSDPCLQDLGLGVRIIHGGMNVQSRDAALKAFREDSSVRVLLMSLKAGGVALNLTVANEAYLMDPWWNPAAEMQAIDRTHRLGQYRPIRAVRFIAEGTVEERILQLQEKKRLVFDGTVGRDAASLKMLTVDDMKAMFT